MNIIKPHIRCIVLSFVLLSVAHAQKLDKLSNTSNPMKRTSYIYVSDTSHGIAIYKMHPGTGELELFKRISVSGQPGSLAVDPTHSFLYAAIRSTNSISSFKINARNGDLTLLSTVFVAMNPVYIKTDRTGRFLLTADNNKNIASVFRIGPTGVIQDAPVQTISTADFPHSIQTDPSNRFLYIPCRSGEKIHCYNFDAADGTLTGTPRDIATPDSTGPRLFEFLPALNVVYFINEFGRSVTAFHMDKSSGALSAFQTASLIPPNVARPIAPNKGGADVHLTPDQRFLYASNRDPDTLVVFSVNSQSGLLTQVAQYPTEGTPRAFDVDPSGNFLYVGGQSSGKLTAYRIDQNTGLLFTVQTYHGGDSLVWVLVVELHHANE